MTVEAPSTAETVDLAVVRARSKLLLGATYRAEVAAAVGERQGGYWTKPDVERQLPGVPLSCLNKELSVLVAAELVVRHRRQESGHWVYSTVDCPDYWRAMRLIASTTLALSTGPGVVEVS